MAYDCWAAPVLWQSAYLWSPDLPDPGIKEWVELAVSPGVSLIAGKTYRITCYCLPHPTWGSWEWWNGSIWIKDQSMAAIRCWSDASNAYTRGAMASGCNYYASSGSWSYSNDLTFRVYNSEGLTSDKQELATINTAGFQFHNAKSQTFTPEENYTIEKIELMLNEYETIRRGYLIVKLERVTMADPGFIWVEETKFAYTDNDGVKRLKEGATTGQTGTAGYLWIESTYLHYIDADGDERRIEGTIGGVSGAIAGHIWVEINNLRYIDSTGQERYFTGTLS